MPVSRLKALFLGRSVDVSEDALGSPQSPRELRGRVGQTLSAETVASVKDAAKEGGAKEPPKRGEAADGEQEANDGAEEEGEDKPPAKQGFVMPGGPQRVVCEPICFVKEQASIKNEIFAREVPATARQFLDAEVCVERDLGTRRGALERVREQANLVKSIPGVVNKYGLKYRSLAPRTGVGAEKTLCWATVHLTGLPVPQTGDDAMPLEEYIGQTQLVHEALQFELPSRFTSEEIDLRYSYLCHRGHKAVVTYKGERAQLAAALATQKTQIRMASNVHVTLKGCDPRALPQANAKCDDFDMTLVDVSGIPEGTSEADVLAMLALPLQECNVSGDLARCEGEHTGWAELIFDSSETAFRIRKCFHGKPFKILRPKTGDDPLSTSTVLLSRADSDPNGYLKATGLPYNVTQADVLAYFDVRGAEQWSALRRDKTSAVLAMRHWDAAMLLVTYFDRTRPWGLNSGWLSVEIVDATSALCRVFASQVLICSSCMLARGGSFLNLVASACCFLCAGAICAQRQAAGCG